MEILLSREVLKSTLRTFSLKQWNSQFNNHSSLTYPAAAKQELNAQIDPVLAKYICTTEYSAVFSSALLTFPWKSYRWGSPCCSQHRQSQLVSRCDASLPQPPRLRAHLPQGRSSTSDAGWPSCRASSPPKTSPSRLAQPQLTLALQCHVWASWSTYPWAPSFLPTSAASPHPFPTHLLQWCKQLIIQLLQKMPWRSWLIYDRNFHNSFKCGYQFCLPVTSCAPLALGNNQAGAARPQRTSKEQARAQGLAAGWEAPCARIHAGQSRSLTSKTSHKSQILKRIMACSFPSTSCKPPAVPGTGRETRKSLEVIGGLIMMPQVF